MNKKIFMYTCTFLLVYNLKKKDGAKTAVSLPDFWKSPFSSCSFNLALASRKRRFSEASISYFDSPCFQNVFLKKKRRTTPVKLGFFFNNN